MQLFKRVLLSLFPDETVNQSINPASMFVSFISTKEFFSVINRKIVENYKLNLFDITIDPFEFKIGFGEHGQLKQKDIDLYYGYVATANLNGYRFLNPANIANSIAIIASIYLKNSFLPYGQEYFLHFLYTVYLLVFIFSARLKVFPYTTQEENFNRFIELFFSFYEFIFIQTGKKIDKDELLKIKKDLLKHTNLFFLLFFVYQHFNTLFKDEKINDQDFYTWLFYDEIKGELKETFVRFFANTEKYTHSTSFSPLENKLLQAILPADILMRYLFMDNDIFLVVEMIISKLYEKEVLDKFLESFHDGDSQFEEFIQYITDYRHFKKNFFEGVQRYLITVLKKHKPSESDDELDELMSSIGDELENIDNIDNLKIPERIKKESKIMEKILNFYITFVGGFWIARGENFFLRLCRPQIITSLLDSNITDISEKSLHYYGSLLYQYGKNIFYYKYVYENVRSGKQRFYLPYKSNNKNIYSNIQIIKLFNQQFLTTLLQDFNTKDLRIYTKNKKILSLFRDMFGKNISDLVKKDTPGIIKDVYSGLGELLDIQKFDTILLQHINSKDVYHLKENIYNIDFWLLQSFITTLLPHKKLVLQEYHSTVMLSILATIRETLLGFLLFIKISEILQITNKKDYHISYIKKLYINEILNLSGSLESKAIITKIIEHLYDQFGELLTPIIQLDDNQEFLTLGTDSWLFLWDQKPEKDIDKKISGEDVVWFRGYLKNITYYNKRFLIPR